VRGLLVLLAATGVIMPPRSDATAPVWVDAHTVQLAYAHRSFDHAQSVVHDDGTGFAPTSAAAPDRTVSPDGRHRYSVDPRTGAIAIDGTVVSKGPLWTLYPSTVAWSPDSTRLAFANQQDERVWIVDADGTDAHPLRHGEAVAWVSDHELVVAPDAHAGPAYDVRDDGTHARLVATGVYTPGGLAVSPDGRQLAFTSYVGFAYDDGAAAYVSSLAGADRDVRRISPDVCTVPDPLATSLGGRCLDGTDGADRIVGTVKGDIVVAGAGDDVIHAGDGENQIWGQWGNDTILAGSGPDVVFAGSGDDVVRTGGGSDTINPGPGRDIVDAGRGNDHIIANDGRRDVIDCGAGDDEVRADRIDVVRHCEHVTIAPPNLDQGY
jgi:hypothetical protein